MTLAQLTLLVEVAVGEYAPQTEAAVTPTGTVQDLLLMASLPLRG